LDKKKGFLNIIVAVISRLIVLFGALIIRRLLIQYIGNDATGLNSLYSSIIGILSVAELGVGSAIVFSMYKPIVEGDDKSIVALYCLYNKLYRIIGLVIFCAGLLVMPFLPRFIKDYHYLTINVYLTFLLVLVSVVVTYLYGAKISLIEAHKDNYITTCILAISRLITYGLQMAVILIWRSFVFYLMCQIMDTLLIWGLTEIVVRKKHGDIIRRHEVIDIAMKKEITENIKAMFMHRIGSVMANTIDSLIISSLIGVMILGKYSNYSMIASVLSGTLALFFTPLTSVVGHLCAEGEKYKIKEYYDYFYCMNYILGVFFFLGYYAVVDNVVRLCFGTGVEMARIITFIVTLNQFTKYMRNTQLLFRNATGTFYYDRWKPLIEGSCNLVLSLLLVKIFPENLKIVGVILATIITTLLICDIVDPYVVFVHAFGMKPWKFCLKNYCYIGLFTASLCVMTLLETRVESDITGILANGAISIGISGALLVAVAIVDKGVMKAWLKTMRMIHREKIVLLLRNKGQ